MRRLTINCDMDGILVDLMGTFLPRVESRFSAVLEGNRVTMADLKVWDVSKAAPLQAAGVPRNVVNAMFHEPGLFEASKPISGALGTLAVLRHMGHRIRILTATPHAVDDEVRLEKLRWLARHLPWMTVGDVIFAAAAEKANVPGDVLIDDRPDTLLAYQEKNPGALVVGIEYPYNQYISEQMTLAKCYRRTSEAWDTILELIDRHARVGT